MSIQDWGAIGEMVGAIAIVVSLIYVGVQLRQSTQATRVVTSQAFLEIYARANNPLFEPGFRDLYWRGLGGLANLQGSEQVAFSGWMGTVMRQLESFYFQWKAGAFEEPIWSGWKRQFRDLLGYPGIQEVWVIRRHHLSDEFREFVEREMIGKESKALYAVEEGAHV